MSSYAHNKRFKTDSQRVAFLPCVKFSDLGGMRKHRYCVAHHLSGRYTTYGVRICCILFPYG
ncbi:TPA: DUF3265 domain-containing protein [Vibrio parahaemolyticus]|nr:DUF3265 domain-containing protein [Vibrio parahaemolyticus]HCH6535978.1 DUF3265 domain-containing protein [Vibrio parahaemolyticus]